MWRRILCISIGLTVGAALGSLCAYAITPPAPESGWTSYTTLGDAAKVSEHPVLWQQMRGTPEFRFLLFLGLLLGGDFGAITGAIVSSADTTA